MNEEHLSPEGREINRRIQRKVLDTYLELLYALKEQGLVESGNLTVLAFNILGIVNWQMHWYRPGGPLTFEEIQDEITAFVLHGMLGAAKT